MGVVIGNLPDGWTWATLENVCSKIQDGTHFSPKTQYAESGEGRYLYITAKNIKDNGIDLSDVSYLDESVHKSIYARCNPERGDLLLTKDGVKTGAVTVNQLDEEFSLLSSVALLKPKRDLIIPLFLKYYLSSPLGYGSITGAMTGTAIKRIILEKIRIANVPIAPMPEQERIVAKIEELFTQLEAGTAALKRVRAGLKRYKASVLKAAVEGRLLNDESRVQNDGELPDGWRWTTIGELAQHLTSGSRGWASYYSDEGSLFVRVGNFNRLSKTIDLNKKQFVNAPQTAEANRTRLKKRDLLITMTADVGMVGIVDDNTLRWGDAYINQHVGLVRLKDSDFVEYVAYALASEYGQKQFREKQYGLTKVGLNFDDIRSLQIPLPPLAEQRRIVAEVERRLSVAQEVESVVAASVARAGRLRQSVLKSAFEGRL